MTGKQNKLSLAESARTLVAVNSRGMLATLRDEDGYPYGSVIDYLSLPDGDVIVLLSRLAEHQRYLESDPRVSLLVAPALGDPDMLSQARVSLLGRMSSDSDKDAFAESYIALHPAAEAYIHFADFLFYRLQVERARYIAGFGRMGWVEDAAYRQAQVDPLGKAASGIVNQMNREREHQLLDYARAFAGFDWIESCAMTALDCYGFDLFCRGDGRAEMSRLAFDEPLSDVARVQQVLAVLAAQAREMLRNSR